ncbi:LIM domain-containing protein [Artemisia annua]|uniref:LIM domain-containing protein n=1 Tax=Artemisia annua TaxID=35608 RepID=A0A2U1NHJ6_ARTAN|nr:LIM domain-containing protein [Artemisia annua]
MGWLTKIIKGFSSSDKYSRKHHGRYGDGWECPPTTVDTLSDFDIEEIDRAIALSLLEEDAKSIVSVVEEEDGEDSEEEEQGENEEEEKDDDDDDDDDDDEDEDENEEDEDEDVDHDHDDGDEYDEERSLSSDEDDTKQTVSHQEEDETASSSPSEEDDKGKKVIEDDDDNMEDDEQLAKAIQESLKPDSPPRNNYGNVFPPLPYSYAGGYRVCVGCNAEIGHGRFLNCMGGLWHPECFRCHACNLPISDYEFSMSENRPFHKSCYKEHHHPKCDVCKNFIPTNAAGLIEYRAHPFWQQKYCPSHEHDRTPRCCSCERMEARDTKYLLLDDGRKLCLECLDSAIMDTHECQPLYLEIQDFYEGLNMKIEQQVPLLLVERQALNEAMEGEKNGIHHHMPETRGLCLSEEQTISTITRRPRVGAGRIMDIFAEPYKLVRKCEVTAILILYSLPRLLTGSILAHEMMHAWLRLKGYTNLPPDVEEGICQVLAHMWLDSEIMAGSSSTNVASSSSSAPAQESSKKGKRSDFEKQLGEFFKHQIESDTSAAYGDGFRQGDKSVLKYGLRSTLDHIRLTGRFPC